MKGLLLGGSGSIKGGMRGRGLSYCNTWARDPEGVSTSKTVKAEKWLGPCPRQMHPPIPPQSSEEVESLTDKFL